MPVLHRTLTPLAVVVALLAIAPGAAGAGCGQQVIDDWQDNGTVDVTFEASCYAEALRLEPADARQYSDFGAAVRRAIVRDRRIKADAAREAQAAARRSAAERAGSDGAFGPSPAAPDDEPSPGVPASVEPSGPLTAEPTAEPTAAPVEEARVEVTAETSPRPDEGPELAVAADGETTSDAALPAVAAPADPFDPGGATTGRAGPLRGPVLAVGLLASLLGAVGCAGLVAQRRREGLS